MGVHMDEGKILGDGHGFFFFRTGWGLNKGPTSQAIMG